MTVTDNTVRLYTRLIDRTLSRYRSHNQWEDIRLLAIVRVFEALSRISEAELGNLGGLIVMHAHWAARNFLESPENEERRYFRNRTGTPKRQRERPRPLDLGVVESAGDCRTVWPNALGRLPRQPDFVPELIERLWREWLWEETFAAMQDEERELAEEYFRGAEFSEIGQRRNLGQWVVRRRVQRGLNRTRLRFKQPPKCDGGVDRRKSWQKDPEERRGRKRAG